MRVLVDLTYDLSISKILATALILTLWSGRLLNIFEIQNKVCDDDSKVPFYHPVRKYIMCKRTLLLKTCCYY